jgi:hypothetical protein
MVLQQAHVFVLEMAGQPAFAFEATNVEDARRMIRSETVLQALDRFCQTRHAGGGGQLQLREATVHESEFYNDLADEFAEPISPLLIAHLANR